MQKLTAVILLIAVVVVGFSSCSGFAIKPVDELMRPPVYSEEYEQLISVFNEHIKEIKDDSKSLLNPVFCPPTDGKYTSAVVECDIDKDETKEAIIFYTDKSKEDALAHICFFDRTDSESDWRFVDDVAGAGSQPEEISICNIDDASPKNEVIVAWRSGTSAERTVCVYELTDEKVSSVQFGSCLVYNCTNDVDKDNRNDIFLVRQSAIQTSDFAGAGTVNKYMAYIYGVDNAEAAEKGSAILDNKISSFVTPVQYVVGSDCCYYYVDALKGENQMITELIRYDVKKRECTTPFLNSETLDNTATFRDAPVKLFKSEKNGQFKIPVSERFKVSYDSTLEGQTPPDENNVLYRTSWCLINREKTEKCDGSPEWLVRYDPANAEDSWCFLLDGLEAGQYFFAKDAATESTVICFAPGDDGIITELFRITDISDIMEYSFNSLDCVKLSQTKALRTQISASGAKLGITTDTVKERIRPYSEFSTYAETN